VLDIIPKPIKCIENGGTALFRNSAEIDAKTEYVLSEQIPAEGYSLCIEKDKIFIGSSGKAGAFYARQTLRQISGELFSDKNYRIPICEIEDAPNYEWRGFMLDEARHFFGKETVKHILDDMALLKLNRFHWHLTDDQGWRIEIKKYPLLTEKGSVRRESQLNFFATRFDGKSYGQGLYYSQEDIEEIIKYAAERYIEIIPETDMPGHMTAAMASYPELFCGKKYEVGTKWGIYRDTGCINGENLTAFAHDVIDELCCLFPFGYYHMGGDETPKSKKIFSVQNAFEKNIAAYLAEKGKTAVGWNEILDFGINKNIVAEWWTTGGAKKIKRYAKQGGKVILARFAYSYFDYPYAMTDLRKTYSLSAEKCGLQDALGIEGALWTEYVTDKSELEFKLYPRLFALAEAAWTANAARDFRSFEKRLSAFLPLLSSRGTNYAAKNMYLCRGILRRAIWPFRFFYDGNFEYKKAAAKLR
jgi:hexosaminidase